MEDTGFFAISWVFAIFLTRILLVVELLRIICQGNLLAQILIDLVAQKLQLWLTISTLWFKRWDDNDGPLGLQFLGLTLWSYCNS